MRDCATAWEQLAGGVFAEFWAPEGAHNPSNAAKTAAERMRAAFQRRVARNEPTM
jgi:hypothetical protein